MNMNKKTFLKSLKTYLNKLKTSAIHRHISYYEEILSDMIEGGLSEEAAVEKLGSPKNISEALLKDAMPEDFKKTDWIGRCFIIFSCALLLISLFFKIKSTGNSSISFIGGADGPTSIFIAGKIDYSWLYFLTAGCIVITILYKTIRYFKH